MFRFPSGFTLLELMIAVAIVGLIAAIAIPSYRDYVVKAKVSEMILAGANAKIAIAESAQIRGDLNDAGSGVSIGTEGQYLSTAIVSPDGVITLTALAAALGTADNVTLVLTPKLEISGVLTWTCSGQGNRNHLPASCR